MKIKHYKLYYNSIIDNAEKFILIDVAVENSVYPNTIIKPIICERLEINSSNSVKLPSVESVLGDKLTVLSPNYTGISFASDKKLELIKQLYDVNNLFDKTLNIEDVINSFTMISNRELKYRNIDEVSYIDVANDVQGLCMEIIMQNNTEHLNYLSEGISKFLNFMLNRGFKRDEELLTAACKIYYLMDCIKFNKSLSKYKQGSEIIDRFDYDNLDVDFRRRLKTIKRLNREQFYYLELTFNN